MEYIEKESKNVVFDSDGILYLSCYAHVDSGNLELMYADFWSRIGSVTNELFKVYKIEKTVIALTSNKNFRDEITDLWKADRATKDPSQMTDKQLAASIKSESLRSYVYETKKLVLDRIPRDIVTISEVAEADDIFIDLCNNQNYIGVAMDSDCIKQCKSPVFNYHSKHWKWVHQGLDDKSILQHIIYETIVGGHNGSFGIKGKGKVFANNFVLDLVHHDDPYAQWKMLFPTEEEALLNYRVTDCSQVINDKVSLVSLEDIENLFKEHYTTPEDEEEI